MSSYGGPVVDAHHHFWEPALGRQPWLRPEAQIPFRYGPYDAIKRRYLPPDLRADAAGLRLVGSVTMETEWELDDPVGEMDYTQSITDRYGLPNAAVAHATLADPKIGDVLAALADRPLVRGVRDKPGQADSPAEALRHPTLMNDQQWRHGFGLLAEHGFSFDLQVPWWHADEAAGLVAAHPGTTVIINHAFLPAIRTPAGIQGWTAAVRRLARFPHVAIKVSGIGVRGQRWTPDRNRFVVDTVADAFGPGRMMFASNFPVDSLTGGYAEIMGGFAELTSGWSASEREAAFAANAVRYYRLDPAILDS